MLLVDGYATNTYTARSTPASPSMKSAQGCLLTSWPSAMLEKLHSGLIVQPLFEDTPQQPAIVTSHKALFASGGDKGLFVESATQADFADRVLESRDSEDFVWRHS